MDTDNFPSPRPQPELADLQARCQSLQQMVVILLLLLLVVTFTIWAFLMRQVRTVKGDLAGYRPQATAVVSQLKPNELYMDDLVKKFQDFGRTNPDFMPILVKYGIAPTNRAPGPIPAPAPAAAPAKKK